MDEQSTAGPGVSHLGRLLGAIQAHEIAEIDALGVYRELARKSTDPVIASLLRVLLEDEEHHHRILRAIAMNLRAVASGASARSLPPRDPAAAEAIDVLRCFARQESDGADELRRLANQGNQLFGGLFALLLNLMAMDSMKHHMILRFIVQELESAG